MVKFFTNFIWRSIELNLLITIKLLIKFYTIVQRINKNLSNNKVFIELHRN